jgi:DNA (cytosine-5)-methyltransferase 1
MNKMPVIDIFAGPGGLGEGFAAYSRKEGDAPFRVVLSIEKDMEAHRTLELRAFFREFDTETVPKEYYQYLRGEISRDELFSTHPAQVELASQKTWRAELGNAAFSPDVVDKRIREATGNASSWVLIGGPPCQAYSIVGRSRMKGNSAHDYESDPRHFLYVEFLRILAFHRPPVFVLENVKGLLSATVNGHSTFSEMVSHLRKPGKHERFRHLKMRRDQEGVSYTIFPLESQPESRFVPRELQQYVVRSEKHGVPQRRHRVILLGVRSDITVTPTRLHESSCAASTWDVIGDLPRLRSGLSKEEDSDRAWVSGIRSLTKLNWLNSTNLDPFLRSRVVSACKNLTTNLTLGGRFVASKGKCHHLTEWYSDENLGGVCNHESRLHMRQDLHRYLFVSCFAEVYGHSPRLPEFPSDLLPDHRNTLEALATGTHLFADRFRVQVRNLPATTVTSHTAKDGHYFIHPDPLQCRSLTVREVARLQTFPDNYFFEGTRTSQYQQVGNAVPPVLARAIAEVVHDLLVRADLR